MKTSFLVLSVYVLTYSPVFLNNVLQKEVFGASPTTKSYIDPIVEYLAMLNAALDTCMYYAKMKSLRKATKNMFD